MQVLLLLLCAVVFGPLGARAQCPKGCECEDTDFGPLTKAKCTKLGDDFLQETNLALLVLDISFSGIEVLTDKTFLDDSLQGLTNLNASHNGIYEIDDGAFYFLTDLKVLDLSHNNLSVVRPAGFRPLYQTLEELYLNANSFLVVSQDFSFLKIKSLDLSTCSLRTLPNAFFSNMRTIVILNLESNKVERFENLADLSELTQLARLNLQRNNLTELELELLQLDDRVSIELAGNPWICDCNFLNNAFPTYKERSVSPALVCSAPTDIRGQEVSTDLADERCNRMGASLASDFVSVANVLVPLIMLGISLVMIIIIVVIEVKCHGFDCVGYEYQEKSG